MQPALHPIGIMADSHGKNELLLNAITALKALGARRLFHLGDVCDSLSPHLITEAMNILSKHHVRCVRGNNESDILHHNRDAHLSDAQKAALSPFSRIFPTQSIWEAFGSPTLRPLPTRLPPKGPYPSSFPCSPATTSLTSPSCSEGTLTGRPSWSSARAQ